MTPKDLYCSAIPYPLCYFSRANSHGLYFIRPSMKRILDFFLLIVISFLSPHLSPMSIALSRLLIPLLAILVSSAKSYGCRLTSYRISSVKSLVKMLNNRHDMPHPYPSPLPIFKFPSSEWITRLLNISCSP